MPNKNRNQKKRYDFDGHPVYLDKSFIALSLFTVFFCFENDCLKMTMRESCVFSIMLKYLNLNILFLRFLSMILVISPLVHINHRFQGQEGLSQDRLMSDVHTMKNIDFIFLILMLKIPELAAICNLLKCKSSSLFCCCSEK